MRSKIIHGTESPSVVAADIDEILMLYKKLMRKWFSDKINNRMPTQVKLLYS